MYTGSQGCKLYDPQDPLNLQQQQHFPDLKIDYS